MSMGCAVISTNTGIVAEVLPPIQRPFILDRNSQQFFTAIKKLDANRALLKKLKQKNYAAYKAIFLNDVLFREKWINFIEFSINKTQYDFHL